ncbi:MAG: hypothetical protein PUE55_01285 [Bacteroidales bacterium]|nr:hypothetical protein [Bacteroidales bacterium]
MKKFFSVWFVALLCGFTTAVSAVNITVVCNPDEIEVVSPSGAIVPTSNDGVWVNGENTCVVNYGDTIKAKSPDVLIKIVQSYYCGGETPCSNSSFSVSGAYVLYPSDGNTYTVTVYNLADIRTASCKVVVDDASKLTLKRGGSDYSRPAVSLVNGENTVAFIPKGHACGYSEENFNFRGSSNWYTLTDGKNTLSFQSYCSMTVTDGATVNVQFNAPDVDVPVKFEGDVDAFAKVEVNGVEVDKDTWSADDYTVKLGSEISLYGNNTDYTLNSLTIKDNKVDSYASFFNGYAYSFTVTETSDYTINLSATKFVPFDIYLTIDHPEYVEVSYQDASYNKQVVTPAISERTKVTLPAGTSSVTINALNADCYIDSIKDQTGKERYAGSINVNANDEFTVWAGQLNRTSTVYINFDDPTLFQYGGQVQRGASSFATAVVTFQSQSSDPNGTYNNGYKNNEIPFDPQKENLFNISLYGNSGLFYLNQKVRSFGSSDRFENVQDKDVIDVYLRYYTFSFEDESSAYTSAVITTDLVKYGNLWVARPGTIIQFTTDAPSVKLGEAELVANDEGVYSVTLDDNATVVLDKATPTAIESVTIEKPRNNNVYTLQGILLIQDASEAQIDALPRGLYIINGEKRIVTNRR